MFPREGHLRFDPAGCRWRSHPSLTRRHLIYTDARGRARVSYYPIVQMSTPRRRSEIPQNATDPPERNAHGYTPLTPGPGEKGRVNATFQAPRPPERGQSRETQKPGPSYFQFHPERKGRLTLFPAPRPFPVSRPLAWVPRTESPQGFMKQAPLPGTTKP